MNHTDHCRADWHESRALKCQITSCYLTKERKRMIWTFKSKDTYEVGSKFWKLRLFTYLSGRDNGIFCIDFVEKWIKTYPWIIGRKGAGKTASHRRASKNIPVVDLEKEEEEKAFEIVVIGLDEAENAASALQI